jgi:hypothetical protein
MQDSDIPMALALALPAAYAEYEDVVKEMSAIQNACGSPLVLPGTRVLFGPLGCADARMTLLVRKSKPQVIFYLASIRKEQADKICAQAKLPSYVIGNFGVSGGDDGRVEVPGAPVTAAKDDTMLSKEANKPQKLAAAPRAAVALKSGQTEPVGSKTLLF